MKSAGLLGVLLLAAGCASAPRPGPTLEGVALPVTAREKTAARRQAIEFALPMFMTPAARREKSAAVDKAVFSVKKMKPFIGYLKVSRSGAGLAEVKLDPLSAALQGAGLIRPPGYSAGPQVVLLAFGNRAVGPTSTERFSADALEVALFGRGIQAQDADDQMLQLQHPITAKTEEGTVAQAAAGGWAWLTTGGTSNVARHEIQSDSWRGRARYSLALYGVDASSTPARLDADGEALDVSSAAAVTHAIEAAAQVAALRMEGLMTRKRVGRSTIAVMVSGYKDPVFINRIIGDLRGTEGIAGAALISWHGDDEMAVIHAYAETMKAEEIAAKLMMSDPKLRITAVESEDGRLTIAGPQIPASEDTGQADQ